MRRRVVVIVGAANSWHARALSRAFEKQRAEVTFCLASELQARLGLESDVSAGATVLSKADLVLVREIPRGSLEQVIYRMDALHQLENKSVRVINSPYAIEKMVDKYYTLSLLQDAGLRVPETRLTENPEEAMKSFHDLREDVVVKPLFGSRGVGMVRLTDVETAGRVFRALQLGGSVYYLQRFIEHNNRDLRVLVVGDNCIAAMQRSAEGWKTNIAAGGKAEPFILTPEVRRASMKAARTLGADYCGVDLLYGPEGELYLLEVNSMPAWQGLQQVTSFDIAGRISAYCLQATGRK